MGTAARSWGEHRQIVRSQMRLVHEPTSIVHASAGEGRSMVVQVVKIARTAVIAGTAARQLRIKVVRIPGHLVVVVLKVKSGPGRQELTPLPMSKEAAAATVHASTLSGKFRRQIIDADAGSFARTATCGVIGSMLCHGATAEPTGGRQGDVARGDASPESVDTSLSTKKPHAPIQAHALADIQVGYSTCYPSLVRLLAQYLPFLALPMLVSTFAGARTTSSCATWLAHVAKQ